MSVALGAYEFIVIYVTHASYARWGKGSVVATRGIGQALSLSKQKEHGDLQRLLNSVASKFARGLMG